MRLSALACAALALAACTGPQAPSEPPVPARAEAVRWSRWFERVIALDRQLERLARDHAVLARELDGDEQVAARLAYLAARDGAVRQAVLDVASEGDVHSPDEPLLHALNELSRRGLEVEAENTAELRALLDEHGWFTISRFGAQADHDGWLLVQHADGARDLQRGVLERLQALVGSGETRAEQVARLTDHLAVLEGRPQRFGTEGRCTQRGVWEPFEIADPAGLAARRAAYGLPPFEAARAAAAEACP